MTSEINMTCIDERPQRRPMDTCSRCGYFELITGNSGAGFCHANPPVYVPVEPGEFYSIHNWCYPVVDSHDPICRFRV